MNVNATDNDSDSDSDSDSENNDDPSMLEANAPTKEFCDNVLAAKHMLYNEIILSPKKDSTLSQDNTLLDQYKKALNTIRFGVMKNNSNIKIYPSNIKTIVTETINYINTFFIQNKDIDKTQYIDYINNHFYVYPFFQRAYF
jgi:hypothetical protein